MAKVEDDLKSLMLDKVELGKRLVGVGSYGRVWEVGLLGTSVAAKEVNSELVGQLSAEKKEAFEACFVKHCSQYSTLRHPNVVQFLGVSASTPAATTTDPEEAKADSAEETTNSPENEASKTETAEPAAANTSQSDSITCPFPYVMLTELMASNLTALLEQHQDIAAHIKLSLLQGIAQGLAYLHGLRPEVVHGRLYSNNILVTSQLTAKLSDIDMTKLLEACGSTRTPTPVDGDDSQAAKKSVDNFFPSKPEDIAAPYDVFAYGGVLIHTCTQQWPAPAHNESANDTDSDAPTPTPTEVDQRQELLEKLTGELKSLAEKCLDVDPKERPTASEVLDKIKSIKKEKNSPFADMNPVTWLQEVDSLSGKLEEALLELEDAKQQITEREELLDQLQEQLGSKMDAVQADIFSGKVKMKWEEAAPMPVGRNGHIAVMWRGLIYVGSGIEEGDKVSFNLDVYSPDSDTWGDPIEVPRCGFGMTVFENQLVITGGKNKKGDTSKTVRSLHEATKTWKEIMSMPTARCNTTAVGYRSALIVIGGISSEGETVAMVELYDSGRERWYTCTDLPKPHSFLQPLIIKNTLYLLGGCHQDPSPAVFTAPLNTTARRRLTFSYYKTATPFVGSAGAILGGKFVITLGGEVKIRTDISECTEVCALNLASGSWDAIGQLPKGRCMAAAAELADDIVVLIGGRTLTTQYSQTMLVGSFDF